MGNQALPKRISKLEDIAIRTIQKDTEREKIVYENWAEHQWAMGHLQAAWYMYDRWHRIGRGRGGEMTEKKIWKNPGYFPNLVKATKPGNPINVKQKKCEEKHPQN